jgi:alpha-glucosidase (family GH31 glycosyl hydrolase)
MSSRRVTFVARLVPVVIVLVVLALIVTPFESVISSFALQGPQRPRPPLTPRWAYEPWVWEDEENNAAAAIALIDGYRSRDIPVGVIIIDSPWQTNYNTFEMDPSYGDPHKLMADLRDRNVRAIFWATGFINTWSNDGPGRTEAPHYREARERGFLVDGGQTVRWDKGDGAAVDFFNPDAVAWWYAHMDKAWAYGIDGWKVDAPEGNLPDIVQTAAGPKTNREYGTEYYRAFYRYVAQRNPNAIITARPYDGGTIYAPVDANPAGWVGDQNPDWGPRGIEEALDNILASAELGYSMLGSDIGGYRPGERFNRLFVRWAQLGALSPLMENGGRGEHRPWLVGDIVEAPYRYFAKLHHQLVPYFYGLGVEAHEGGPPIIRDADREERHYRLGEDLFVAPMVNREASRRVDLPDGARWYDYWDDSEPIPGGTSLEYDVPLERSPLFVRGGAIIPMQVSDGVTGHGSTASAGALTLVLYPDGITKRTVRPDAGVQFEVESRRQRGEVMVSLGATAQRSVLRIKERSAPATVAVEAADQSRAPAQVASHEQLDPNAASWFHDAAGGYLWVSLPPAAGETTVRYTAGT